MKELKITKGEWSVSKSKKGHWDISGDGWVQFGRVWNIKDSLNPHFRIESHANAQLIADAGTTANKCGLLPSELLEQRDMLLDSLKYIEAYLMLDNQKEFVIKDVCKKAIQKTEQ